MLEKPAPLDCSYSDIFRMRLSTNLGSFQRLNTEAVDLKRAAVGIVLVQLAGSDETAFLLTLRASTLRSHGGQYALPGGRCDLEETAIEAALREIEEELGMGLTPDDVMGVLDDYPTRSGYVITPVVFWGGVSPVIVPNPDEVAEIFRIGLRQITHDDAVRFITIEQSDRPVVQLLINEDYIHAPTAAILYQFREVLLGRTVRVHALEQPVFAWR